MHDDGSLPTVMYYPVCKSTVSGGTPYLANTNSDYLGRFFVSRIYANDAAALRGFLSSIVRSPTG